VNITLVPVAEIDNLWPSVSPMLLKCWETAPGYLSLGEFWQMCRSGTAFVLVAHDEKAIVGTSIWQFQRGYGQDVFSCLVLAGENAKTWLKPMFDVAAKMAKNGGATSISATGRLQWQAMFDKHLPDVFKPVRQSYLAEV